MYPPDDECVAENRSDALLQTRATDRDAIQVRHAEAYPLWGLSPKYLEEYIKTNHLSDSLKNQFARKNPEMFLFG
jgi:hypothetical protein